MASKNVRRPQTPGIAMTKMFKLRALRAPMYDARTGKKYREVRLVPGRVHTFGRSRSCCDVVFSDSRVSRQHCQVYWNATTNQLLLFEGAPVDTPQIKTKPSLNGVYVDGRKLAQGGCHILKPGYEVSLVACTKDALTVNDPGFGDAVGFFVEAMEVVKVKSLCPIYPRKPVHIKPLQSMVENPRHEESGKGCIQLTPIKSMLESPFPGHTAKGHIPLPTFCRKRALVNCGQGAFRATDEKSSISFDRRSSSSKAREEVRKKPKRSTTEIMGLLRQQREGASGLTKVHDPALDERQEIVRNEVLKRSKEICVVPERKFDNLELSGECAAKVPSRISSTGQDRKMLSEGLSKNRLDDCEAITSAPARTSSAKVIDIEDSRRDINAELATKREAGNFNVMAGNISHSAGKVYHIDETYSRAEEEEANSGNAVGLTQENMSSADTEDLNGAYSGSAFLLNRLKDMDPASQVNSQPTVSLQELLNPTDGLLGIFVATFTSDIMWFLSSHNISPELPVTVACHDHDRCWSTAEESRTSSPFPNWPNVNVLYPVFPDSCCFATEKRQGIGCHHPKIFLLPRKDSIRVIVTSANLTQTQWLHVTNSVWWQDFPRRDSYDYEALFCASGMDEIGLIPKQPQSDFAIHLSSFIASLVADVPSAAHWALDLAEFDFSNAAASLVTSVPGLFRCPCPPVPPSVRDLVKKELLTAENGVKRTRRYLAAVNSSVVGVSHRFKDSADPCGKLIRTLAAILSKTDLQEQGMLKVQLERITNLTADLNAVSVVVSSDAIQGGMEMVNQTDRLQMAGDSLSSSIPATSVHIGFLPRHIAKWVAPLYDTGVCTFAAFIQPNEVIGLANGMSKKVAQLVLYVFEGRAFSSLSTRDLSLHHTVALCGLLRNMERPLGLWRLHQILSKFNWLDAKETNFIYGSSSIGTSLDAAFLAAFSVAAGKKAIPSDWSEESDSQWGAWTAEHEANAPSIGVIFPTIQRVEAAKGGPFRHQAILCFAESTWERLKTACLLYDAVPFPAEREGIPMHVKKGDFKAIQERLHMDGSTADLTTSAQLRGPPPPNEGLRKLQFKPLAQKPDLDEGKIKSDMDDKTLGLDKFVLPFCVPAPKYVDVDQPATKRAMYNVAESLRRKLSLPESGLSNSSEMEMASSEADDEGDESQLCLESGAFSQVEEEYGGLLWSQVDPSTLQ